MWIVSITRPVPALKDDFPAGFFPRTVRYKEQAQALQREVEFKGGIADVRKANGVLRRKPGAKR